MSDDHQEFHYDRWPFEFLDPQSEREIESQQPAPFAAYVKSYIRTDSVVADIGCGPGRATLYLTMHSDAVTAVDLSRESLRLAAKRAPKATFVHASNLDLPLDSRVFDAVVSDGVIHHTPDPEACFRENCRILKPSGFMFLAVYRRRGYYFYVYNSIGRVVRFLCRSKWGLALVSGTLIPAYHSVQWLRSGFRQKYAGSVSFFHDYFTTPIAHFFDVSTIEAWCRASGMEVVGYVCGPRNVHSFVLRKADVM
jgi:ubiquinone/menaquinone biosynthesis C-methylase UbiE